jgi:hypothetical protein
MEEVVLGRVSQFYPANYSASSARHLSPGACTGGSFEAAISRILSDMIVIKTAF